MKIRNGFVSNSSSSSFVCEVCGLKSFSMTGEVDCCEDAYMKICEPNGIHVYCEEHETEAGVCPICSYSVLSISDAEQYFSITTTYKRECALQEVKSFNKRRTVLRTGEYMEYCLKKLNTNVETVFAEIKMKYPTYTDFRNMLYSRRIYS